MEDNYSLVLEFIQKMKSLKVKKIYISLLKMSTTSNLEYEKECFLYNPEIVSRIIRNAGYSLIIQDDYLPHDFLVIVD